MSNCVRSPVVVAVLWALVQSAGCAEDSCPIGDRHVASGVSVPCEDGCNTCECRAGSFSSTEVACAPLPKVVRCGDEPAGVVPVEVLYLSRHALALRGGLGGCGGPPPALALCWDGAFAESFPVQVRLRLVAQERMTCASEETQQKVFDLTPLREAYRSAYRTDSGSIQLSLEGDAVRYTF